MADETTLYRLYDADGALLYIGVTADLDRRLDQHRMEQHWGRQVARIEIKTFSSRAAALAREREEIPRLRPQWNIEHAGHPHTPPEHPRLIELGQHRRLSLGKLGFRHHDRYLAHDEPDGTIVLRPLIDPKETTS